MTIEQIEPRTRQRTLRLWPGVVAVALQWLIRFGVPLVLPDALPFAVIGGVLGGLVVIVWWAFFSRVPWPERVAGIALMIVAMLLTPRILHESIAKGMMGMMFAIHAIPVLSLAFVVWAAASRRLSDGSRRASMAATILIACGVWALVRTGGMTGNADSDFQWRWAKTPEERLLAQAVEKPVALVPAALPEASTVLPPTEIPATRTVIPVTPTIVPTAPVPEPGGDWPGFRGRNRDGVVTGVRIETDWSASPPIALWRRQIGPAWSSFAVSGDLVYTQEQRGDSEVVSCYSATNGKPVWSHRDAARFWESNAGAGPRATPTLSNGRVYTFGATGILNALNARDGSRVWSRNAASDTNTKLPGWGFAGSPVVVGDVVIVAASGQLVGYGLAKGDRRWVGPTRRGGYSSPHLVTLDGVAQVLLLNGAGAVSVAPADGKLLWEHQWASGSAIVQPALAPNGDVLISNDSGGLGLRRLAVAHTPQGWTVAERWTSAGLKPYFNDFVVHNGHAFGFDGAILACVDLKDGKRKWKGGRYGHGQLVVLADQDLLLVISEEGELALVE
ncbi:MAG: PQQ-binding-like beta-propeller repeat protein, partial [Bryobacteraceae bacterium]|nr:PQQ-binding-like beta-propeller repeat protein [Bryobacteraceae bacterium]